MKADLSSPRTPFTLADLVHITGGRVVQIHHNACQALATGRAEDCRCDQVDYRLIRTSEGKQR